MYPQQEKLGSRKNYLYFGIINKRRNQMTSSDQHASQVSRSFRGSGACQFSGGIMNVNRE